MRVVSLIASSTEIVYALDLEHTLVGRSHECDYPPSVTALPQLTAAKLPDDGTSYEIDQRVRALVQEALSVYRVDADRLRSLHPDVILTQTQCEVCAVSERDVQAALADWTEGERPEVVSLTPHALADIWADIGRVAGALGEPGRAQPLVRRLQARVAAIVERSAALAARPTVACVEWIEPLMAAGNWVPELVAAAGGTNTFGEAGRHSPWLTWSALEAVDPEFVIIMPCGFDIPRSRAEARRLEQWPEWARLAAVRGDGVAIVDGVQYFNRPGPRIVESLEILAEILHPEAFDFGHRGRAWEPL